MKKITSFLIIFFLVVLYPIRTYSAEILQINNSSSILVGDQNRDLPIKLFCVEINNEDDEKIALNLLKKEFPRGSKVKIKPIGFKENISNKNIDISNLCTYESNHNFHSWRRTKTYLRQWNFISCLLYTSDAADE